MRFTPVVLVVALCVGACGPQAIPSNTPAHSVEPELTEAQAISAAAAELKCRFPGVKYQSFHASRGKDGWVVEAVWNPQGPGGSVSVFLSPDGTVQNVIGGM